MMMQKQQDQDNLLTRSTITYQSKIDLKLKVSSNLDDKSKSLI